MVKGVLMNCPGAARQLRDQLWEGSRLQFFLGWNIFCGCKGTQIDPSMNSHFDGENYEPPRFWGIVPYFQRNPGIAICVRCGFNRGSGSLTQAAAAAATKKATDGMLDLNRFSLDWVVSNLTLPSSAIAGNFQRCWTLGGLSLHFHGHGPQEVMALGFNFRSRGLNDSQLCTREICVWQSRDSSRGQMLLMLHGLVRNQGYPPKMIYDMIIYRLTV